MPLQQIIILMVLISSAAIFMWGQWRHAMLATGALFACMMTGVTPATGAFPEFGHPAVTVAIVLVPSPGLQNIMGDQRIVGWHPACCGRPHSTTWVKYPLAFEGTQVTEAFSAIDCDGIWIGAATSVGTTAYGSGPGLFRHKP